MATNVWEGGAAAVAQVDSYTITGTWAADDYVTFTIGNSSVTFTVVAGSTAISDVHAGIVAAWNASTGPELTEVTAGGTTPTLTLTADTAGVPFTATYTESTAGDGTFGSVTATTANSGPNDAAVNSNWSTNDVPGADAVVFENSSVSCLYNLDQLGTVAGTPILTSLVVKSTFTGYIGLPRNNANGYVEYRPTTLELGTAVTAITIGEGDGAGSGRINLTVANLSADLNVVVNKTGGRATTGIPALQIVTGTQAANDTTITVNRGDVGIASNAGESAVVDVLEIGYVTSVTSDAEVKVGSGVTLTTVTKSGGTLYCESGFTTLTNYAGTTTTGAAAAITTATINGGTLYHNSSGTIATAHVASDAILDFRQDGRDRTVDNTTIHAGGKIYDPAKTVTWTNGIDVYYCALADVTLDVGEHTKVSLSGI